MPARLPPNRTVNSRAVLAKMERWSRAALARLAKQAEHTDRSGATQTVFHSTASSLPIPFVICRLLLTASSAAKYDEKSGLTAVFRLKGRSRVIALADFNAEKTFVLAVPHRFLIGEPERMVVQLSPTTPAPAVRKRRPRNCPF